VFIITRFYTIWIDIVGAVFTFGSQFLYYYQCISELTHYIINNIVYTLNTPQIGIVTVGIICIK